MDLYLTMNNQKESAQLMERNNSDTIINKQGKELLDLINSAHLVITNGRVPGDLSGHLTCHKYNGSSVVDYCIVSNAIFKNVISMQVYPHEWYSDHSPIGVSMRIKEQVVNKKISHEKNSYSYKYKWEFDSETKFKTEINQHHQEFQNFCEKSFPDINDAVKNFDNILNKIAAASLKTVKINYCNKKKKTEYDTNCQTLKSEFKKARRAFTERPKNAERRNIMLNAKKKFRKAVYKYKNQCKENKINKIADLKDGDPRTFWRGIKDLLNNNQEQNDPLISVKQWYTYFQTLLNSKSEDTNPQFSEYINTALPILEQLCKDNGPLDDIITKNEIEKQIRTLKLCKSAGIDRISNEMLKYGKDILLAPLAKIFNQTLEKGIFPQSWKLSVITPIHKAGNIHDPSNYRGIAISSCVGKLFCKILNARLVDYLNKKQGISVNQCGFKQGHRTEDNLYILDSVVKNRSENGKQKTYVAFIDFAKFFDKINREKLFYKLIKSGIYGNFYKIIKSLYADVLFAVKTKYGNSPFFTSNQGVKQGCCLSPTLSNIFQNDLHDIFDKTCDPVYIRDHKVNSLSWADDLILLSNSETGLQQCLNRLSTYCSKWGLTVNENKTKCIVFSSRSTRKQYNNFYYEGCEIECVSKIKYLGIYVHSNGKIETAVEDRILKANRAIYMVKQALSTDANINCSLTMNIFQKQILPILTYGCAIWGLPKENNYIYLTGLKECTEYKDIIYKYIDKKNILFCKRVGKITQLPKKSAD